MRGRPEVGANDVLIIGNYLFAGRALPPALRSPYQITVSGTNAGTVYLQADVAYDRPLLAPYVAAAYLHCAADILARLTADVNEEQLNAAAASLLLPKARLYAEEVVPRLVGVAAGSGNGGQTASPTQRAGRQPRRLLQRAEAPGPVRVAGRVGFDLEATGRDIFERRGGGARQGSPGLSKRVSPHGAAPPALTIKERP
jgi:hypothetical protein